VKIPAVSVVITTFDRADLFACLLEDGGGGGGWAKPERCDQPGRAGDII